MKRDTNVCCCSDCDASPQAVFGWKEGARGCGEEWDGAGGEGVGHSKGKGTARGSIGDGGQDLGMSE